MPNNNQTTTRFNVDISQLKAGIQEANRQIRLANAEFRAAASGMDDWRNSADGLSAKIKQLETVLQSENKKLENLKAQLALVEREQGANSRAADELRIAIANQQTAINNTERELRTYSTRLHEVEESTDDLNDSLEDTEGASGKAESGFTILKATLADLAARGIAAVTSALKDMTTELLTDGADAYAKFAAATGTATENMEDYKDAINEVYKDNFGESLEDVAGAMLKVKEVTGEMDAGKLKDMTEKAMTLEDVFDMDMTETLRGVNSLMDHFGLTSEEAFDLISSGAQNGLNYTDELGDNVAEYAGKFAEAGYSSDEYFQLLKNGADGGAYNLDKVNDAINEVTARLADGTIEKGLDGFSEGTQGVFKAWQNGEATQKDVIASIVKDIQNTTGEQEKMNLAALAFGTMAEDGGTKFIEALTPVGDTFNDVTGKAQELADVKYDTPAAKLQSVGRTLKVEVLQPLAEKLTPVLQNIADWVANNVPNIIKVVSDVAGAVKKVAGFISDILPLLAALGTALIGLAIAGLIQNISSVGLALKTWAMSTKLVTAAQWLLNAAMAANPITLVVIAIAALVAALVVLWKKSDKFREAVTKGMDAIKKKAQEVWEKYLKPTLTAIAEVFIALFNKIKELWENVLKPVFEAIANVFINIWNNYLQPALVALGEFFVATFNKIRDIWENILKPTFETLRDLFVNIWNNFLQPALVAMGDFFVKTFNVIKSIWENVLKPTFNAIVSVFKWLWEVVIKVALVAMAALFATVWNGIKLAWNNVLKPVFEAVASVFQWVWEKVLSPTLGFIKEAFNTAFDGIKYVWNNVLKPVFDAIGNVFSSVWNDFLSPAIESIKEGFQDMSDVVSGIWNGLYEDIIKPIVNSILSGIESLANGVVNGMNVVIGALNNLSFEIPDWVPEFGGEKFGFDIDKLDEVELPRLASGGILKRGQVGLLEGNGAEAVIPLENNKKWIGKTAKDLKQSLQNEGILNGAGGSSQTVNNYNFTQNNTSPKALSRLEIYRQTKNQLNFAKGV